MNRQELIKRVALKMDEISSSDRVIVSVNAGDNNPLYTQINDLLNESINDVLTKAPIFRLQSQIQIIDSGVSTESIEGTTRVIGIITVPNDFIRIVSISDAAFKRPIVDLAIEGDDISNRQSNKFLMAKNAKPVAVLCRNESGSRIIKCFSYDEEDTPDLTVFYVKRYDSTDMDADMEFDDYIIDIISWTCAGRVFAAQGDTSRGQICDTNAAALMI